MKKFLPLFAFAFLIYSANAQFSSCTAFFLYSDSGLTVTFTDSSYGTTSPTTWNWGFGDGFSSTQQSPSHTYAQAGTYAVCLTVTKPFTNCQSTFCDSVVVTGIPPCVDTAQIDSSIFCTPVFEPVCGCDSVTYNNSCEAYYYGGVTSYTMGACGSQGNCYAGFWYVPDSANQNIINFYDASSLGTVSYQWDFGDSTNSTIQNPIHTYLQPGQYNVCLITQDSLGCSDTSCQNIFVGNQSNCYAFYIYIADSIDPLTFLFTDSSSTTTTDWYWDFGDGDSSLLQNPSHTFDSAGNYTVCLTINDSVNNCTNFYCDFIVVSNCNALFSWVQDSANPNTINFTDNSSGSVTGWQWDFGDGSNSNLQNPAHTFPADGGYWVCLTITDSAQNCTDIYCNAVYAGFQSSCNAYFSSVPDSSNSFTINFYDYSFGNPAIWSWSFGDGSSSTMQNPSHTYAVAGTYQVCLNISDSSGNCNDSLCDYITVVDFSSCIAYYTYSNPFGNWISFTDSSSGNPTAYFWEFGDSTTSTQQNPFHNYADTGMYFVCLTISDSATNCFNTYCNYVYLGTQQPPCLANFSFSVAGNVVSFADASVGAISNYFWNFGDNNADNQQNTIHTYTDSGYYNVCLTVSDFGSGCFNTFCDSVYIAPSPGGCQANFTYTAYGDSIAFADASSGTPVAWSWDFGDFQTSTQQNPSHTFPFAFTYTACLTITAANGCYNTYCDSVVVVSSEELMLSGSGLQVYPNPNNGKFELQITDKFQIGNIEIYNLMGEKIYYSTSLSSGGQEWAIDLSNQPAGLYFFYLDMDSKTIQKKLVIVK